ncbi:poly-gamma-glutamate system protein [Endozoicomonas sp. SM1973]|uniref:Poly-gamma-glutamate system protein n=1 Tax=Spartinivicinus marinus TaxID=2994442 RepID=A0A853HZR0_9GAMM|nr:poly-gamma-glutamate system protein [Spartinivicinus marinus]MCX4028543.1 poly-gamma-glutamate system protein [Spartinivicinus marinus]NYZ67210.1 poly-gamma-glutamate system protein [Spartinivicinus marinus]
MKSIYRRPYQIHTVALLLVTLLAVVTLYIVEWRLLVNYKIEMKQAVELAKQGSNLIKKEKQRLGLMAPINVDLKQTGLIGTWESTPITSIFGHLSAKQASLNPDITLLIYRWLKEIGVEKGDYVAISATGSFPALNLYTYAALQTIGAKPLIMLSLTASQWGANQPEMLWIDMGSLLYKAGLINFIPMAVSYGAKNDLAINLSPQGIQLLQKAIQRNNNPSLIYTGSLDGNIEEKWLRFNAAAGDKPIKAFINIGGGKASVGSINDKKKLFKPGLNRSLSDESSPEITSLMWKFISTKVPVIHLSNIEKIIAKNQLTALSTHHLYQDNFYQRLFAVIGFIVIVFSLLIAANHFKRKQQVDVL